MERSHLSKWTELKKKCIALHQSSVKCFVSVVYEGVLATSGVVGEDNPHVLTSKPNLDSSPALAWSRVPAFLRVRNIRPMYHGMLIVMSGSLHEAKAWPSKCIGESITEERKHIQHYCTHTHTHTKFSSSKLRTIILVNYLWGDTLPLIASLWESKHTCSRKEVFDVAIRLFWAEGKQSQMFVCGQIFSRQPGGSLLMRTMQNSYMLIAWGKTFYFSMSGPDELD